MNNSGQDPSTQLTKEVDSVNIGAAPTPPTSNLDFLQRPAENYTFATGNSAVIIEGEKTPPASTRTAQGGTISFAAVELQPKSPEERGLAAAREVIRRYSTGPAINIGDALNPASETVENIASKPDVLGMGKRDIARQVIEKR